MTYYLTVLLVITPIFSIIALFLMAMLFRKYAGCEVQLKKLQHTAIESDKALQSFMVRLDERGRYHQDMADNVLRLLNDQQRARQEERARFDEHQINNLKTLQESLQNGMTSVRQQVTEALTYHGESLNQRVEKLTLATDQRLKEISSQVEKRLSEGFEKTTATFADVVKRLALIDEAQKKITELSSNVVGLQEILGDKKSRGAFGEVQLMGLIRNMLPEKCFAFQHTLSNDKRVDCMLFLPEPTGNVVIDAKFPLESYRQLTNPISEVERKAVEQNFRRDIRTHIQHIASKYIVPGETADGAMMFIPAEAIFAEIHAHYPDLVEIAQKARVWMVSPTTMMAILTTTRAVLKDAATRKQVHIIQEHLVMLNKDFQRFQKRMEKLAVHIKQAHEDVEDVHTSSKKISQRFSRIEKVELEGHETPLLESMEVEEDSPL
ncbi:MAG TPA: DNA recombination protein RmuC [Gammaproteobacteria bacterium]|nr:DNA recombination protein RmuC [Gammaproteobacteria bacterium]